MRKQGEVERKNREKMAGGRNKKKKKKIERENGWVGFSEKERINVKKKKREEIKREKRLI